MATRIISSEAKQLETASWAEGTDEQIVAMIKALDSGRITIEQTGWKNGDERVVHLNSMEAIGVGEAHAEQDVVFVLMDNVLQGLSPVNGDLHFIVGMKDCLNEKGYMNSTDTNAGGWKDSKRRTWCNEVFANALPATFAQIFKQFSWKTGDKSNGSTGLSETIDTFALPVEKMVLGSSINSQADEAALYSILEWYKTPANRLKKVGGTNSNWWEASPRSSSASMFCGIKNSGDYGGFGATYTHGIAPFGCI